jgi:hypothetical protein
MEPEIAAETLFVFTENKELENTQRMRHFNKTPGLQTFRSESLLIYLFLFHSLFLYLCIFSYFSVFPSALLPFLLCFRAHLEQMGWIGLANWRVKESLIIPGIDPPSYLIPKYEAAHRFPTGMRGL